MTLTVRFSEDDLNNIFGIPELANEQTSTYLSIDSHAVSDTATNSVLPILVTRGLIVSTLTENRKVPVLQNFTLDMGIGQLVFTFSETVVRSSVNFDQFTIQSSATSSNSSVTLTSGTITDSVDSEILTIMLDSGDLFRIQQNFDLATSRDNTFLSLTNESVVDAQGQGADPILSTAAFQVGRFISDNLAPVLQEAKLDLNSGVLELMFNEVINGSTLVDLSQIVIQDNATSPNVMLEVDGSSPTLYSATVIINLSVAFQNSYKADATIATDPTNTFVYLKANTLADVADNFNAQSAVGLSVDPVIADTTSPSLLNFTLDLNVGELILTFDETVNATTFDPTGFTLQRSVMSSVGGYTFLTSQPSADPNSTLTVILSESDLNSIKEDIMLATSAGTSFLSFTSLGVSDMSGNAVRPRGPTAGQPVSLYVPDMHPPALESFDLNMDTGVLSLTFDEYVRGYTLNLTAITFRSSRMPTSASVTLTDGDSTDNMRQHSVDVVSLALSTDDLNALKANTDVAISNTTTYITTTTNLITDSAGNPNDAVTTATAIPVTNYVPDVQRPSLVSFGYNVNTGVFTFNFDETILARSLMTNLMTLEDTSDGSGNSLTLSNITITDPNGATIDVLLDKPDRDELSRLMICVSDASCYLSFPNQTFTDTSDELGYAVTAMSIEPTLFVSDSTNPELVTFVSFDLDEGLIELLFDETMLASSVDFTGVILHEFLDDNSGFRLTTGKVLSNDSTTVIIEMDTDDLNELKKREICESQRDCWVRMDANFITDVTNNTIVPVVPRISAGTNERTGNFTGDTTSPLLTAFSLNMNSGRVVLTFDEPVSYLSVDRTQLTFFNTSSGGSSYTLNGGPRITTINDVVYEFELLATDLRAIKAIVDLATDNRTTFLNYTDVLAEDLATPPNSVDVSPRLTALLQVDDYVRDSVGPSLVQFDLIDMNNRMIRLSFSEPMDIVFNASAITIQSHAANTASGFESHTLTGGVASYVDPSLKTVIEIVFSEEDLQDIKLSGILARSQANSYISFASNAFFDTAGNQVGDVPTSSAELVAMYLSDTTSPTLISFDLDMNLGLLVLHFDDVINSMMIGYDQFELRANRNPLDSTNTYTLVSGATSSSDDYDITVNITLSDLNAIKRLTTVAIDNSTTFLSITAQAARDVFNNPVTSIIPENSLNVTIFTPDITAPVLDSFFLDVDAEKITFSFSETVNVTSFSIDQLVLQNGPTSATTTSSYSLNNGTFQPTDAGDVVELYLSDFDLNRIKLLTTLGTNQSDTYLSFTNGTVLDMFDNPIDEISTEAAIQAASFVPDATSPELIGFCLDMNTGQLTLTFSESVDVNTFNATEFAFQSMESLGTSMQYPIMSALPTSGSGVVIETKLSTVDVNNIKARPTLAISPETTFITVTMLGIADLNSRPVVPILFTSALNTTCYVPDSERPVLMDFTFDLGSRHLALTFDETVNHTSVNMTKFTVYNSRNASIARHITLSQGVTITTSFSNILVVEMTVDDINFIKIFRDFGTNSSNTFLVLDEGAVLDMVDLPVSTINVSNAVVASQVFTDTLPPVLMEYTLDMGLEVLTLTFSETVDTTTLDPTGVTLQNSAVGATQNFTLTGGTFARMNTHIVSIQLDRSDADDIKRIENLAVDNETVYLYHTQFVRDINGIAIASTNSSSSLKVTEFIHDQVSPSLVSFDFIQIVGVPPVSLVLRFSETVRASSLQTTGIVLQLPLSEGNVSVRLSNVDHSMDNSPNLTVYPSLGDFRDIQVNTPLGKFPNSTYVSIDDGTVDDMNGQPLAGTNASHAIRVSTHDVDLVPPVLDQFTFDLNRGELSLTFREDVNVSTLDFTKVVVQSDAPGTQQVILSTGRVEGDASDSRRLRIFIDTDDLNAIKANSLLAVNDNTTYLGFLYQAIYDIYLNPNDNLTGIQVSFLVPDVTRPVLTSFNLNLKSGLVTLTFSETVNSSLLQPNQITLQATDTSDVISYTLTGGIPIHSIGTIVDFSLDTDDLNEIKRNPQLAISNSTTYFSFTGDLISDMMGNRLQQRTSTNALGVTLYTPDDEPPELDSFQLDLNEGVLTLSFSETVNVSSLNISDISLEDSDMSPTVLFQLSDSYAYISQDHSNVIRVLFTDEGLNLLKNESDLCSHELADDCFLSLPMNAIVDMADYPIMAIVRRNASLVINDTTSPNMTSFVEIDLETGIITMEFDETVVPSTLQPQYITLQSLFADPLSQVNLTNGTVTTLSLTTIAVTLSMDDLVTLKNDLDVCTTRGNCWMLAGAPLVQDTSGNLLTPVTAGTRQIVQRFIPDETSPVLLAFDLNMNTTELILEFNEPVDITSGNIDLTGLTLQRASFVTDSTDYYTLTGGMAILLDPTVMQITLDSVDANAIKSATFVTSRDDTYLVIANDSIFDLALIRNSIVSDGNGTQVRQYTNDTVGPRLLNFVLDLERDTLMLTFDEPVNVTTLNFTGITVRSGCTTGSAYQLTTGEFIPATLSGGHLVVSITLDPVDLIAIKSDTDLATDVNNTFLVMGRGSVFDVASNEFAGSACLSSSLPETDTLRMQLVSFDLDINNGRLNLTFDDVANASTFMPEAFQFQIDETAGDGPVYRLTSGSAITNADNGYTVFVQLSPEDHYQLKLKAGLATDENNTYLTMHAFGMDDTLGRDVVAITDTKALKVGSFEPDTTPPNVTDFSLDMNRGVLTIMFDDTVNTSTIIYNQFVLRSAPMATGTAVLQLSSAVVNASSDGLTIDLQLTNSDLNVLKLNRDFAVNASTTFFNLDAGSVDDLLGNPVMGIPPNDAIMAGGFTPDSTGPQLVDYQLNMTSGVLVMTFNEAVAVETLNYGGITFQDLETILESNVNYTLTTGSTVSSDGPILEVTIEEVDRFGIQKELLLTTSYRNTHLSLANVTVQDMNGNYLQEVSMLDALRVKSENFFPDVTPPSLRNFVLDMDTGILHLNFSKVILVDRVVFSDITLQNDSMLMNGGNHTLNTGVVRGGNTAFVDIELQPVDLNALKVNTGLATSAATTWISFPASVFVNTREFNVEPISSTSAMMADDFVADTTPPVITRVVLDMNTGYINFTFSESVQLDTFTLSSITLHNDSAGTSSIPLQTNPTAMDLASADQTELNIQIQVNNLNAIKMDRTIGTSVNNTHLELLNSTVLDYNDISFVDKGIFPVDDVMPDTTGPRLIDFTFDVNRVFLTFDEVIDIGTFDQTKLVFRSVFNTSDFSLTGTSNASYSTDVTVVRVDLSAADLNGLTNLGNAQSLTIASAFARDFNGNPLQPVSLGTAGGPDLTPPKLSAATLDMNTGLLTVQFDEFLDVSKIDVTNMTLLDDPVSPTQMFQLTGVLSTTTNGSTFTIALPVEDQNEIKARVPLVRTLATSYITMTTNAAQDFAGNSLDTSNLPLMISTLTPDAMAPNLESFRVDWDQGTLVLSFDEPVLSSPTDFTAITLQEVANITDLPANYSVTLTNGTILTPDSKEVVLQLVTDDLNTVFQLPLCTDPSNCYLSLDSASFMDVYFNPVVSVPSHNAVMALNVTEDNQPPQLAQFVSFDLDTGELVLSFSETVNSSTVNVDQITLQSWPEPMSTFNYVTLTSSSRVTSDNDPVVTIIVSNDDRNQIKATHASLGGQVCTIAVNCYVRLTGITLMDMNGNNNTAVANKMLTDLREIPANYTGDQTSPRLEFFNIDLTNGTVSLTFDETVNFNRLRTDAISIQGSNNSNDSISLLPINLANIITTVVGPVVEFRLTADDIINLQADRTVATSNETTYLILSSQAIVDFAGLGVVARVTDDSALLVSQYTSKFIS